MHCLVLLSGPCTGMETESVLLCWSPGYEVEHESWSEMMCRQEEEVQLQSSWVVHCQLGTVETSSEAELDCCEVTAAPVAEQLHYDELCLL